MILWLMYKYRVLLGGPYWLLYVSRKKVGFHRFVFLCARSAVLMQHRVRYLLPPSKSPGEELPYARLDPTTFCVLNQTENLVILNIFEHDGQRNQPLGEQFTPREKQLYRNRFMACVKTSTCWLSPCVSPCGDKKTISSQQKLVQLPYIAMIVSYVIYPPSPQVKETKTCRKNIRINQRGRNSRDGPRRGSQDYRLLGTL